MSSEFLQRCLDTAGLSEADVVVDPRGLQNLVFYDRASDLIWRFPRRAPQAAQLALAAHRYQVAAAHGVPTARVLAVHADPTPGVGHLVLSRVPGTALDEVGTDDLPQSARDRLVSTLIEVVATIGAIPPEQWPGPGPSWVGLWADLHDWTVVHAPEAVAVTAVAWQSAQTTDIGVFHGDLGGVNCRIDPVSGAVQGVLDWDNSMVGDRATDVAAILAGVGPRTAAALLAASPLWAERAERYRTYVDTWPVQGQRWAANSG